MKTKYSTVCVCLLCRWYFYVHRIYRLTPVYAFVLLTVVWLYRYVDIGPFWPQVRSDRQRVIVHTSSNGIMLLVHLVDTCRKRRWTTRVLRAGGRTSCTSTTCIRGPTLRQAQRSTNSAVWVTRGIWPTICSSTFSVRSFSSL